MLGWNVQIQMAMPLPLASTRTTSTFIGDESFRLQNGESPITSLI